MVSLVLFKKFNPFVNNFYGVFLNYNKHFTIPKCFMSNKKCKCFSKRKEVTFSFDFPMSFIQIYKKHITKYIFETEKHNNLKILNLSRRNLAKTSLVKESMLAHFETLNIFLEYINNKKTIKFNFNKYEKYVKEKKFVCEQYLNLKKYTDSLFIELQMSLYNHYHTLKLFESLVNKLNK